MSQHCQDWCSALGSGTDWPNLLIEQCNGTPQPSIPSLPCTGDIYYPPLHNLVHFGICSDKLHQRLVSSFIFPRDWNSALCVFPSVAAATHLLFKTHMMSDEECLLKSALKKAPAIRVSDIFKSGWSQKSLLSASKHGGVAACLGC